MSATYTTIDEINDRIADILREEAEREARAERVGNLLALAIKSPTVTILDRRPDGSTLVIKTNPTNKSQVARARAAIAHVYRHNTGRCRRRSLLAARIAELERYMGHRYGRMLPDDDAGRHDLTILLNHLAQIRDSAYGRMRATARVWTRVKPGLSWIDDAELDELIGRIIARPRRYTAKKLGELTRLTEEEHAALGITSWWPYTWGEADVRADQKQRRQAGDRDAKTAKRRRNGVIPREEYEAKSKSQTKPWEALGMSRPTYYRKLKAGEISDETSVSPLLEEDSYRADTPVSRMPCAMMISTNAINLDGFDFKRFGITAIRMMSGTSVISEWTACEAPQARSRPPPLWLRPALNGTDDGEWMNVTNVRHSDISSRSAGASSVPRVNTGSQHGSRTRGGGDAVD